MRAKKSKPARALCFNQDEVQLLMFALLGTELPVDREDVIELTKKIIAFMMEAKGLRP